MPGTTAPTYPANGDLAALLFLDEDHRRWFVEERIERESFDHLGPVEADEQRPELGPILVRFDDGSFDDYGWDAQVLEESLFVAADELPTRIGDAERWARTTAARDIFPAIITYTLTADGRDFASLTYVPVSWLPPQAVVGDTVRYQGRSYPLPARAIAVEADGQFEIRNVHEDDAGELWFEVEDLATRECLFLSAVLLATAACPT